MKNTIKIEDKLKFDICIIDAMNYCFKYFFSYKNLFDQKNRWTGLYYGYFNLLFRLKKEHPAAKIIITWDRTPSVRLKLDEFYKANREDKKDKMAKEMIQLRVMLSMYGITQLYANGYEADDVICKVVKENKNKKILIYSSDKDLFQLLTDNVFISRKKGPKFPERIYSKDEIEEDFNIIIENYTLYKAIIGDMGDNVVGVYGINKKETKRFVDFIDGEVSRIYSIKNLNKFNKIKRKIILNFAHIENNYDLVKLYDDFEFQEIEVKKDLNRLKKKFEDYGLKQALKKLEKE